MSRPLIQLLSALVLLAAFTLQAAYLAELRATFPNSFAGQPFCGVDARAHLARAGGLLDGSLPGNQTYFFIPLYPFYLALFKTFGGDSILLPVFGQLLLQMVGLAALYRMGRLVFSPLTGILAALGLAGYNYYHFYLPCYDQVLLTVPFLTLAVFFSLKYHAGRKPVWLLLGGAALALAALSRPTLLAIFPVVILWVGWINTSWRQRLGHSLLLILSFIILVSPITWHNYRVSGRFILLSDNFGVNLFTGNNPDAQGLDSLAHSQSQPAVLRYIETNERVKAGQTTLTAEVLGYIRAQPGDWLALTAKKIWLWFGETDERLVTPFFPLSVSQSKTIGWLPVGWQAAIIAALLGLLLAAPEAASRQRLALLGLVYGALSVTSILFFVQLRFRLPFAPFVMLAAASLLAAAPGWSRRRSKWFWLALTGLLLLYPLVPGLALFIVLFIGLAGFNLGRAATGPGPAAYRPGGLIPYPVLALIALYLVAVGLWVRANALASDVSQTIDHYLGPPLAGAGILGQTFQMDCDGLHHVQIVLGLLNRRHDRPVTFYLARDMAGQDILFSETFEGGSVSDYQKRDFFFTPVPNSAGQTFFFFLASPGATPENSITARGYTDTPVDHYPAGAAWAGQLGSLQQLQADFAFTAYCNLSWWEKLKLAIAGD
jgi:hypothetical protein